MVKCKHCNMDNCIVEKERKEKKQKNKKEWLEALDFMMCAIFSGITIITSFLMFGIMFHVWLNANEYSNVASIIVWGLGISIFWNIAMYFNYILNIGKDKKENK